LTIWINLRDLILKLKGIVPTGKLGGCESAHAESLVHDRALVLQGPHAFDLGIEPERLDALDLQIQRVYFGKSLIGAEVHIHLDDISGIIHLLICLQIEKLSPQVLLIRERNLGVIKQERPSQFLVFLY